MKTRRFSWIFLPVFAALACTPAHAKEPLRLAASSNWHVDYGADYCRLARQYGEGENIEGLQRYLREETKPKKQMFEVVKCPDAATLKQFYEQLPAM